MAATPTVMPGGKFAPIGEKEGRALLDDDEAFELLEGTRC
jgi:hypothetical protein